MPDIFPFRLAIHYYHSNYNTISLFVWTEEMLKKTQKTTMSLRKRLSFLYNPELHEEEGESVNLLLRKLPSLLQWALGLLLLPQTKEIHDGWPDNQPNTFHTCHYTSSRRNSTEARQALRSEGFCPKFFITWRICNAIYKKILKFLLWTCIKWSLA